MGHTTNLNTADGFVLSAYRADPAGTPRGGLVVAQEIFGVNSHIRSVCDGFAADGYAVIAPALFDRYARGFDIGYTPDDIARGRELKALAQTDVAMRDIAAARDAVATAGKVGVIGSCSGGRHALVYASTRSDVDACADLWGGRVVMTREELNAKTPIPPIDMTNNLSCPLLGIFGNDDRAPSPEQVNAHEVALQQHSKVYEFHRYDGAGHGFFYWNRPIYRVEQTNDGWAKIFAFFGKHLA